MVIWWASMAWAVDADQLVARAHQIASFRSQRLAEGAPPLADADYRRAAKGEVVTGLRSVEGYAARKAYGLALLDVSIASLYAGINDEVRHTPFTSVRYSELLVGAPCESGRRVLMVLPLPLISDRWWVTVLTKNASLLEASGGLVREIAWQSSVDPSELTTATAKQAVARAVPLGFTYGGWFLWSLDPKHTVVEYYLWTDPGGQLPARAASMFAANGIANTLKAMERYATEGRTRCALE